MVEKLMEEDAKMMELSEAECKCLPREEVPPLPTEIPFPATEENMGKLM